MSKDSGKFLGIEHADLQGNKNEVYHHRFGRASNVLQGAHPRASHSFDLNQKKQSIKPAHQHTKGSGIL